MTRDALEYRNLINRIASVMLIFLVSFFAFHEISYAITYSLTDKITPKGITLVGGLLEALAYFFSFLFPALTFKWISRKNKMSVKSIPAKLTLPKNFPLLIIAAIGVTLCFAFLNAVFLELIGYDSGIYLYEEYAYGSLEGFEYVIMFISVAIVPAFCEELLFRGVIMKNLVPYGKGTAVIVSALLFALMHQNPAQFLYTFFGGIILALVCIETGSIWCSVFIHLFNNAISVFEEVISTRLSEAAAGYIISIIEGTACVGGFVALIILVRLYEKKKKEDKERIDDGFFCQDFEQSYYFSPKRVSVSELIRSFCTPMMLTFCILAIVGSL